MSFLSVSFLIRHSRALLVAGLLLRVLCLPLAGTGDVDVWKTWSYGATRDLTAMYGVGGSPPDRGVVIWHDRRTTVDYPPATLYALGLVGRVYRVFDPPFRDTLGLTIAIKASILVADALVCLFLFTLLRCRFGDAAARTGALMYWLNPGVLLDGAVLGYLDSWAAAPALAAFVAADAGAPILCGIAAAVAVMMKAQAVFVVPFAMVLLIQRGRIRAAAASLAAAAAAGALMLSPFVLRGAFRNVLQGVGSLLRHDMLSATAANLWWIVTWILRASYAVHDLGARMAWTMPVRILGISRVIALGYPNPRLLATLAVSAAILWSLWTARRSALPEVLAAGAFAVYAYFVLGVQVHENHLFLALPLLAGAAAVMPRLRAPLAFLSATFSLNLFLFYGIGRGFPLPPRGFTGIDATVLLSAANVAGLVWVGRRFVQSVRATCESTYPYDRASPV